MFIIMNDAARWKTSARSLALRRSEQQKEETSPGKEGIGGGPGSTTDTTKVQYNLYRRLTKVLYHSLVMRSN